MPFIKNWILERYLFIFVISFILGIFSGWGLGKLEVYFILGVLVFIFKKNKIYIFILIISFPLGFIYSDYILEKTEEKSAEYQSRKLIVLIEEEKNNNYTGIILNPEMKVLINRKINFYYKGKLEIGERYSGIFKLGNFKLQRIPGGFNEKIYYFSNNVFYKGKGDDFQLIEDSDNLYSFLLKFRKEIMGEYREQFTGKAKGLLPALVFGDKSLFPEETRDSFQLLGISHLLAVSGLHGGIIAGAAYKLFSPGGFYFKNGAAWFFLLAYSFLAGFSPSINRAALMFFFFSLRKFYLRYPDPWTILSLSAIPQILINPFVVFSAGFQLSYLTIGGIVLFHKRRDSKISLSFAAVAGTLPIVIYYFNKISFIGILVNLFYVPLFSLITLLAMLSLCFNVSFFTLYLDKFVNFIIFGTEQLSEKFLFLDINISSPEFWEILLYYCFLFLILSNRKIKLKISGMLLIFLLIVSFSPKKWEISFLDVGQGDSTFIFTENEKTILIDGGPWGKEVEKYLSYLGINNPDLFIVTHGDADHINGIIWLIETHPPKSLLLPINLESNVLLETLLDSAKKNKVKIIYGYTGQKFYIGNTTLEILSPDRYQKYTTSNNHSLVVLVSYENKKILLTGDIEKEIINKISIQKDIDILKAPHHGSNTGVSKEFFNNSNIKLSVISCGENNLYGHPGEGFLNLLKDKKIPFLRTDSQGTVSFIFNGKKDFLIKTILD